MIRKIFITAGLILALTPFVLFPVCDTLRPDGSYMGCWYSGVFITIMGILIFTLSFIKKFEVQRLICTSIFALACWLIPNRIINIAPFSLCANPEHACRAETMPAVGLIVMLIIAVSIAGLAIKFVRGE